MNRRIDPEQIANSLNAFMISEVSNQIGKVPNEEIRNVVGIWNKFVSNLTALSKAIDKQENGKTKGIEKVSHIGKKKKDDRDDEKGKDSNKRMTYSRD